MNRGFTFIELMIVMAILSSLFMMGLFFDMTFYRGNSFSTDVDSFASILQRARAKSINNINAGSHGVYIGSNNYVLFQCPASVANCTYASRDPALDQSISHNPGLTFSGASEVVFSRLSGDSSFEGFLVINGSGKSTSLYLNNEGLINR